MTRLRSSTFALRATADRSSFGEASPEPWRRRGGGEAPRAPKNAGSTLRHGIVWACTTAVAVMIGGSSSVLACPMCFGAEETSMIDGAKLGVLVMLGITLTVQGGFVGFFLYLRKRARRNAEVELEAEWSELQRASKTS